MTQKSEIICSLEDQLRNKDEELKYFKETETKELDSKKRLLEKQMKIFEMGSKPKNTDQEPLDESFNLLRCNLPKIPQRRSNSENDKR